MDFSNDTIELVKQWVIAHKAYAPFFVFALAFAESLAVISLLIPAWGVLVAMGGLIALGALDFVPLWIGGSVGAALGDWVSYWLGFKYKYAIGTIYPLNKFPNLLPKGEAFFNKYGVAAICLGRFSGPFRASVPLIAGITGMNRVTFQLANWSSAFLWAGVLLSPGIAGYWFTKI
jgi:membrane protein DedA with SNARE-associated domain